jgi:uncharacterized damage-inducible protein DinB
MTKDIFVQMALKSWNIQVKNASKFFDSINDESLSREIAPGKNTIKYLLGHLIAVNDGMITLFGLGERRYAYLDEAFINNPDKAGIEMPDGATLKAEWRKSNGILSAYFEKMTADDWFARHNSMTDQDLVNEPGRNKLSVLLNRTNHLSYHLGQLILATEQ